MLTNIIGRKKEQIILAQVLNSNKPELLALYGRRRVGKSFLINEFFEKEGLFFDIIGSKNEAKKIQLNRFLIGLEKTFGKNVQKSKLKEWDDAFFRLIDQVDLAMANNPTQKIILFFDEIPWLDSCASKFLSALDYAWNKTFCKSKYKNVKIVICGSSATWMIKKIITNKAGLHNRLTAVIRLLPFTLAEVNNFLEKKQIHYDQKQIVDLYMAFGGVPKYWTFVARGQSTAEMIENLIFDRDGQLYQEFDELYSSLFDDYKTHLTIVKALAASLTGMTQIELFKKCKLSTGGTSVDIIKELEASGFVQSVPLFNAQKKGKRYRLIDEYSLFYLKWVLTKNKKNSHKNLWQQVMNSQEYKIWAGFIFENICLKHIEQIKKALGISGIYTEISCWYNKNAQIDLLIDRSDKAIHLCEMKYYDKKISNTKSLIESINKKATFFKEETKTKKYIIKTLISTYGTVDASAEIDKNIAMEELFN